MYKGTAEDMAAADLERIARMAVAWQNLHEEWACSASPARKEIASFAWSAFVKLMRVLDEPSPHMGEEKKKNVKYAHFPGDSDITERRVGSLCLRKVVCPTGEWYSIM